jgi:hypothetical protein
MDLLLVADINAIAVSLLENGFRDEALAKMIEAYQKLHTIRRRKQTNATFLSSIIVDTDEEEEEDDDDDDDVRFDDGTYRCFYDAPLNSPYDNAAYSVQVAVRQPSLTNHTSSSNNNSNNNNPSTAPPSNSNTTDGDCYCADHGAIYTSVFLLSGDLPIVMDAVFVVLVYNLALFYHLEGLLCSGGSSSSSRNATTTTTTTTTNPTTTTTTTNPTTSTTTTNDSLGALDKAKVLYEQAFHCLQFLLVDKPILLESSVALRVLGAVICYNVSHIYRTVHGDTMVAMSYLLQFQSHVESVMMTGEEGGTSTVTTTGRHENNRDCDNVLMTTATNDPPLHESDYLFFQTSLLFVEDMKHSHFMFSPAA